MKTFSATVRSGNRRGSWWTTAIPSARACGRALELRSARRRAGSSPLSGWWTPARILTSVLLPAPFSPTSAWTSPGSSSSETSSSACVAPNRLEMPRSSTRARRRRRAAARRSSARSDRDAGPSPRPARACAADEPDVDAARRERRDHRAGRPSSVSDRRRCSSVGQNVANAARSHLVWSTMAMTSRAAATIERLIWASSSVASLRPESMVKPAAPRNAFWTLIRLEQAVAELADDRQGLPAHAPAEHQRR